MGGFGVILVFQQVSASGKHKRAVMKGASLGWLTERLYRLFPFHNVCNNSTAVSTSVWIPSSDTKSTPARVS